jgi:hypothetical protein
MTGKIHAAPRYQKNQSSAIVLARPDQPQVRCCIAVLGNRFVLIRTESRLNKLSEAPHSWSTKWKPGKPLHAILKSFAHSKQNRSKQNSERDPHVHKWLVFELSIDRPSETTSQQLIHPKQKHVKLYPKRTLITLLKNRNNYFVSCNSATHSCSWRGGVIR